MVRATPALVFSESSVAGLRLGYFNHRQRAWLVCYEAGVIIELPPGAVLFLPSALVTHWHVEKKGEQ